MYVQSDTLFLSGGFENFRNMCLKIYELDPEKFLSAPGLAWQAALKWLNKITSFTKLQKLHELHNYVPFLPERMKIEKVEKLVANLYDKTEYVIHMRNFRQPLNHELVLKKYHRVTKFNQNAWLKPYINMNTDLRKKAKNDLEKDFFKLMKVVCFRFVWDKF